MAPAASSKKKAVASKKRSKTASSKYHSTRKDGRDARFVTMNEKQLSKLLVFFKQNSYPNDEQKLALVDLVGCDPPSKVDHWFSNRRELVATLRKTALPDDYSVALHERMREPVALSPRERARIETLARSHLSEKGRFLTEDEVDWSNGQKITVLSQPPSMAPSPSTFPRYPAPQPTSASSHLAAIPVQHSAHNSYFEETGYYEIPRSRSLSRRTMGDLPMQGNNVAHSPTVQWAASAEDLEREVASTLAGLMQRTNEQRRKRASAALHPGHPTHAPHAYGAQPMYSGVTDVDDLYAGYNTQRRVRYDHPYYLAQNA
ncbi:hypothetical protein FA95DRAFT_1553472, partial [Auriscalpium vulgare]